MKTQQEQLNEAAEKYAKQQEKELEGTGIWSVVDFKAGALSPEAANGCNKHVEKAKIEFAIEYLNKMQDDYPCNISINEVCEEYKEKLNKQRKRYE